MLAWKEVWQHHCRPLVKRGDWQLIRKKQSVGVGIWMTYFFTATNGLRVLSELSPTCLTDSARFGGLPFPLARHKRNMVIYHTSLDGVARQPQDQSSCLSHRRLRFDNNICTLIETLRTLCKPERHSWRHNRCFCRFECLTFAFLSRFCCRHLPEFNSGITCNTCKQGRP